jgi:hypothetical protein
VDVGRGDGAARLDDALDDDELAVRLRGALPEDEALARDRVVEHASRSDHDRLLLRRCRRFA